MTESDDFDYITAPGKYFCNAGHTPLHGPYSSFSAEIDVATNPDNNVVYQHITISSANSSSEWFRRKYTTWSDWMNFGGAVSLSDKVSVDLTTNNRFDSFTLDTTGINYFWYIKRSNEIFVTFRFQGLIASNATSFTIRNLPAELESSIGNIGNVYSNGGILDAPKIYKISTWDLLLNARATYPVINTIANPDVLMQINLNTHTVSSSDVVSIQSNGLVRYFK